MRLRTMRQRPAPAPVSSRPRTPDLRPDCRTAYLRMTPAGGQKQMTPVGPRQSTPVSARMRPLSGRQQKLQKRPEKRQRSLLPERKKLRRRKNRSRWSKSRSKTIRRTKRRKKKSAPGRKKKTGRRKRTSNAPASPAQGMLHRLRAAHFTDESASAAAQ